MAASFTLSAVAASIALILVFLITVPTLLSFYNRINTKAKGNGFDEVHKLYEDRDGVATEESQKAYSAAIPKYIALSACVIGVLASFVMAVFTSTHGMGDFFLENWLIFGSWV